MTVPATKPRSSIFSSGTRNRWFRPVDVCIAPDGSLFVADWYDPGVGGHAQQDTDRGRIFRVAPKGSKYVVPKFDFNIDRRRDRGVEKPVPFGPLYGVDPLARSRRRQPSRHW